MAKVRQRLSMAQAATDRKRGNGMVRMHCIMLSLTAFMLPAFVGFPSPASADHPTIRGPATAWVWELRSLQGQRIHRSAREVVTLRLLPDHSVAGTASCNSIGGQELTWIASTDLRGTFRRDSSQPTIMTQAGCPNAAEVAMAGRFWTLMTSARAWVIDRGYLVIRFGDGTTALLKPIGPAARRSDDCRNADPNNLDCPRAGHARGAKPR